MRGASKVGALVVVFGILIWGAYAVLGRALFGSERSTYYARFPDAGGVTTGAKVLLAGVEVGGVQKVELLEDKDLRRQVAFVTLAVNEDVRIPVGTEAVIPGALLSFGDNGIELEAPSGAEGFLKPGSEIPGRKGGALDEILPDSKETVAELNKTLIATRKLLEDQGLRKDIRALLQTSNDTLEKFGQLSAQTQGLVAENRVLIRSALQNASLAMRDVREGTQLITKVLREGKVEERTIALMDRLNATSAKAEHLVSSLDALVSDPQMQSSLKQSTANVEKITDSGTRIAASTEIIAKNGEVVSEKAIEVATKASELADEAKRALQDVRGFLGRGSKPKPLGIKGSMDLMRQTDPNYWRTDVEFFSKAGSGGYHVGLWDAFESNKFIIQLGRDAGSNLYYRYGIYAAKPGVGVDYHINDRLLLRGDLFDVNDPRFDLRARVDLGGGMYGWAGVDRIFDKNAPTLGIGFQK